MTSRLGFPRRSLSALACGATLFGVSACGSSTPQVSQALKSKLESTLEKIPLTATEATEVTNCLVPTFKTHGITTLAAANAYGTLPAWGKSAELACLKQAGLTGTTSTTGNTGTTSTTGAPAGAPASGSGTDTNSADAAACSHLVRDAQQLIADNGDAVSSSGDIGAIGQDLQGVDGTDGGSSSDPTGNSDMSQSLATVFNAVGDDVSGGGTSNMTAESVTGDAQAVVSGCASAGVSLPSGFASAVSAAATNSAAG